MSRYFSYINSSLSVLSAYHGTVPFAAHLKQFFAGQKKFGSRDRKEIAAICYAYFRAGRLFEKEAPADRILKSVFICAETPNDFLRAVRPEWNEHAASSFETKCSVLNCHGTTLNLFPWQEDLSDGIDVNAFSASFLVQPDFFLRLRPGWEYIVPEKLRQAGISFRSIGDSILALPNSSKIDTVIQLNKEAVVQDLSSQQTGSLLRLLDPPLSIAPMAVWDCCAASGGKSIMVKDLLGNINLAVSDVRESILHNLKKRFSEAGIKQYKSFVSNLAVPGTGLPAQKYDLVIADVPCTGSGTWSRTPEQLFFFQKEKIEEYASLQKRILSNIAGYVKSGGHLLYITCSVFKKENESALAFLKEKHGFREVKTELFTGYEQKADTMFASLLRYDS